MSGAADQGCIWILQQLNFPCWCAAQIGCDELRRSQRECQLQTDIDPQTVAERQPQHGVRHGESMDLNQGVNSPSV